MLRAEVTRKLGMFNNAPLRVQSADGSPVDGLMSLEEVAIGEQNCLLIAWLEITERKRAENGLVACPAQARPTRRSRRP